jgi:hypothetical protein
MTFLHPWAIWIGAAAAALPVAVHLLTRPRPVRLPLSTLRFVREAVHQRRARHRLRDLVILALRTAAVLLLALAVARPQWGERPLVSDRQAGDTVRVVILDVSQSMAATERGIEAIERARTAAAGYLRYRPGLQANLILAGAMPRGVFEGPSTNFDALRDELARCEALPQRLDVNRAFDVAALMLAPESADDDRRRELVVVSDFQGVTWGRADFSRLPADTQIQLESTAPQETPPNLAILKVDIREQSSQAGGVHLEVEVGNFSLSPQQVHVEVAVGEATWRLKATCPAKRSTTLSEQIELRQIGWQPGEARLVGVEDALAADNVRPFVVCIRPEPVYALLTREPSGRRASSSHFVECALAPEGRLKEKGPARVLHINPSDADAAALAPADLILLDHPGKLTDDAVQLLAGLLRRGRPVLYVASELIDATNLKRLAEAAGSGLQMPVEFAPPPAGQLRRNLFLTNVRREEPPFRVFGDNLNAIVGQLRFAGGLNSRRLERGVADDVLATYSDGSACMVLSASDAGVLAVVNADLAASNLPKTPAFVPLLDELVQRMLHRGRAADMALCGEQLVVQLPNETGMAAGLHVVGRSGRSEAGESRCGTLTDEGGGVAWHWPAPDRPGVYSVKRDDATLYALAVSVPAEESDLDPLTPDARARLAGQRHVYFRSAMGEGDRRDDFWKWFAAACVVCMLCEIGAMLVFRD